MLLISVIQSPLCRHPVYILLYISPLCVYIFSFFSLPFLSCSAPSPLAHNLGSPSLFCLLIPLSLRFPSLTSLQFLSLLFVEIHLFPPRVPLDRYVLVFLPSFPPTLLLSFPPPVSRRFSLLSRSHPSHEKRGKCHSSPQPLLAALFQGQSTLTGLCDAGNGFFGRYTAT